MRVIVFIEDYDVIRKILVRLALWDTRIHNPVARKNRFPLKLSTFSN